MSLASGGWALAPIPGTIYGDGPSLAILPKQHLFVAWYQGLDADEELYVAFSDGSY